MRIPDGENRFVISFCVIAYNEDKNIGRLLENLLQQTYPRELTEVVFVDSCSKDTTKQIMEKFREEHMNEYREELLKYGIIKL
jgi:glycosyltransferase involved in cell wall biosynthesis